MSSRLISHADNIPDVLLALNLVGFDATLDDVQSFVSLLSRATIIEGDLKAARDKMTREGGSGKQFYSKADRLGQLAEWLLITSEGRDALRWAMKRAKHEDLLGLLSLNGSGDASK